MGTLKVITPGARTLVQDTGFQGGRGQGIPPGGVMDRMALALVNGLLGNPPRTAALEVTLTAPTLTVADGPVRIALSGTLSGQVRSPDGSARALPPWTATTLAEGDRLHLSPPAPGAYGLIGIAGGPDLPVALGSRSTCLRAGFGGFHGRALQTGDALRVGVPAPPPGQPDRHLTRLPPADDGPIRVVPGPQAEWFDGPGLSLFLTTAYRVTTDCDRMGMRLDGPALPFASGRSGDILSDGIVPGAVQVPGSGQPIILLADAQTTGGYPKIATVIGADLPRLSRLSPGDAIRFAAVTVAEAEVLARAAAADLARLLQGIADRPATMPLLGANLIGGMVDMRQPDHFDGHLHSPDPKAETP